MNSNKLATPRNALTVGFIGLLIALAAFSFSYLQTPNYKSTVKLLAVFNQSSIDTYTASKTANYITGILGEVIYSDSFIDSVYRSESNLADNLGRGSEARQKAWKKIVKTQILDNRGIISIDVYGNDKNQTNLLASAIGSTIVGQHGLYDGSQDRVAIRMIDTPSVYESWSAAKIMSDTGLGLIAGLLAGLALIVIFPNHKLFESSQKKVSLPARPAAANGFPASMPAEAAMEEIKSIIAGNAGGRSSNPWLDQYYQENLNDNLK